MPSVREEVQYRLRLNCYRRSKLCFMNVYVCKLLAMYVFHLKANNRVFRSSCYSTMLNWILGELMLINAYHIYIYKKKLLYIKITKATY